MKKLKFLIVPALGLGMVFTACKKDDKVDPVQDVYTKSGLLVNTSQEVPAVTNSNATGTMDVTYKKSTKLLTYKVNWASLSDSINGSHIHGTVLRGINAPVKVPFDLGNKGALTGSYTGTFTVDGTTIKEDSLLAGFYYLNIHTKKNPNGEVRGQIEFK